jgi:hypothetical protein
MDILRNPEGKLVLTALIHTPCLRAVTEDHVDIPDASMFPLSLPFQDVVFSDQVTGAVLAGGDLG